MAQNEQVKVVKNTYLVDGDPTADVKLLQDKVRLVMKVGNIELNRGI